MLHCHEDGIEKDKDDDEPVERLRLYNPANLKFEPLFNPPDRRELIGRLFPFCTIERDVA